MSSAGERERVLELVRRHGWNTTSFQVLKPGFRYWFSARGDACVGFVETRAAWVAAGSPIAPADRLGAVVDEFGAEARAAGRRAAFFAAQTRLLSHASLRALAIGEQPVWTPGDWPTRLAGNRSLREQLRRARAKGVRIRSIDPRALAAGTALRTSICDLIDGWLETRRMAPMGFLVAVQPFDLAHERRYFLAEREGAPVAFLAAAPVYARDGWFFEDVIRDQAAPNGTTELLIDAAMRHLAAEGAKTITLGLAPLAGALGPTLRLARNATRPLYDFEGLHAFRAKLRPEAWEPIYLAHPPGASSHVALVDALEAFAHGSFLRFGRDTLLRLARRNPLFGHRSGRPGV